MKKIMFFSIPLLAIMTVAAVVSTQGFEANFADYDGPQLNIDDGPENFIGGKGDFAHLPIDFIHDPIDFVYDPYFEDSSLRKDTENLQDINQQKQFFNDTIGKGADFAHANPFAFKNLTDVKEDIFDTDFLSSLYDYGDYHGLYTTLWDSKCSRSIESLAQEMTVCNTISARVEAQYACFKAEVSTTVGFSTSFSTVMTNSSSVYLYDWLRLSYLYKLPLFEDHTALYKNHLTDQFKADLAAAFAIDENEEYFRFFDKYGTHVIMEANYGGAANIYGSIISSELQTTTTTTQSVEAEVGAGFSFGVDGLGAEVMGYVGTGVSLTEAFGVTTSTSTESFKGNFYGGNSVGGSFNMDAILYNASVWMPSVDQRPVLVQYNDAIPVWDLLWGSYNAPIYIHALQDAYRDYRNVAAAEFDALDAGVDFNKNLKSKKQLIPQGLTYEQRFGSYVSGAQPLTRTCTMNDSVLYNLQKMAQCGYQNVRIKPYFEVRTNRPGSKVKMRGDICGVHRDSFTGDNWVVPPQGDESLLVDTCEAITVSIVQAINNPNISLTLFTNSVEWWNNYKRADANNFYIEIDYLR